jgi:hypothetical protein
MTPDARCARRQHHRREKEFFPGAPPRHLPRSHRASPLATRSSPSPHSSLPAWALLRRERECHGCAVAGLLYCLHFGQLRMVLSFLEQQRRLLPPRTAREEPQVTADEVGAMRRSL